MLQKELTKEVLLKRKDALETVIKRRFIYQPAFAIYGGIAGLYDYGPVGCAIKNNIEQYWREHFIIEDDLFEIAATCLTPEAVLKASGHVDRFTDLLVTDSKTNQGYRADKIVTETLEKRLATDKKLTEEEKLEIEIILKNVDSYKEAQISEVIAKYKIVATETGNELTPPQPFNLMLPTSVGPSTKVPSFLRPETAQGMFLNFPRLLEQSGYKLPFGAAQIGLGFRNEIAPRGQLLRCREFQMAEIEYFVDPQDKNCKKFHKYRDLELPLLSKQNQKQLQDPEVLKMGLALEKGIVGNETLAYMIIRTYLYLVEIGINKDNIRFRQHQDDEKAHYSQDCWDAEIETSSGWVECVGLADRAAYDLTAHSNATGQKLQAARKFKQPEQRNVVDIKLDKAKIGKELKKDGTVLMKHIESLSDEDRQELFDYFQTNESKEFQIEGLKIVLNKALIQFEKKVVNVMEEKFVPHVIEPAFGIGRILQAVVEHSFRQRDDPQKTYFKFSPKIAPVKVSILPVIQTEEYDELIERITKSLKKQGISCKTDASGVTIGKKYARTDEIGIPFALTVYGDSLTQDIVTLREIETTKQVTIKIDQVPNVIYQLSNNIIKWEDILKTYPIYEQQQE